MKCLTVFELEIHDRIPVIENGIGINGGVAVIADGISFPKPDMGYLSETSAIHPFAPAHAQIIMYADFFQYENSHRDKNGSKPIITKQSPYDNGWALVLWIIKKDGPNYFTDEKMFPFNALPLIGPLECQGYIQYLFIMANEHSNIMVKPKEKILNLHYSRGTLKFDKVK